jgi:hypothetical protein
MNRRTASFGRSYAPKPPSGDDSTVLLRYLPQGSITATRLEAPINVLGSCPGLKVIAGPPGIEIGASYYGPLLDRKRPKRGNKPAADELIRPRRPCQCCGAPLPVWRKGRRVPVTRKFCDMCR